MLMPVGWIDTYHKFSRCAAEGSGGLGGWCGQQLGEIVWRGCTYFLCTSIFFLGNPLTWLILVCKYCLDSFWLTLFLYSKTCHVKSWSWDIHLQVGRIPWVWWPFWLHRQAIHVSWQPSGTPSLGCQFKVPAIQKGIYCFTRFFFCPWFSQWLVEACIQK